MFINCRDSTITILNDNNITAVGSSPTPFLHFFLYSLSIGYQCYLKMLSINNVCLNFKHCIRGESPTNRFPFKIKRVLLVFNNSTFWNRLIIGFPRQQHLYLRKINYNIFDVLFALLFDLMFLYIFILQDFH